MLILNIRYANKLYQAVTIDRRLVVDGQSVDTEVSRYAFGDPTLDWRLMRFTLTYLDNEGLEVHRGASCDKFIEEIRGYKYDDNKQLVRDGE